MVFTDIQRDLNFSKFKQFFHYRYQYLTPRLENLLASHYKNTSTPVRIINYSRSNSDTLPLNEHIINHSDQVLQKLSVEQETPLFCVWITHTSQNANKIFKFYWIIIGQFLMITIISAKLNFLLCPIYLD